MVAPTDSLPGLEDLKRVVNAPGIGKPTADPVLLDEAAWLAHLEAGIQKILDPSFRLEPLSHEKFRDFFRKRS